MVGRVALVAALSFSLAAGESDENRPVVEVPRLDRAPTFEEFLSMEPPADLAATMARVGDRFIQRYPTDGKPSSRRTEVFLGYDDDHLYAVFLAFDEEPAKIRATLGRRETIFGDDIVQIMLDTFRDRRRAYSFICNPLGVQFDAVYTEASEFDSAYDTVWRSRGAITDRGYVVWMEIPFRSLRFPVAAEQAWGLLLNRDVPRDNEESFWPEYTTRIQGRLNQMGTLRGLRGISPGRNVQFIPYAASRRYRVLDPDASAGATFSSDRADTDVGLDAKFVLRDAWVFDLTAKPDFSQVESDEPQVTVNQRFELFYPEKRPFFLENAATFDTPIDLVFTRRIGEPRLGARVTAKTGPWSIGALAIDDEAPGERSGSDGRARFGIARVAHDVGRQSSVGLLVTSRDFADTSNAVVAADARVKWNENWTSSFQAARSRHHERGATAIEDDAWDLSIRRDGEHFFGQMRYVDFGPDFRTDTGFVPRVDVRDGRLTLRHTLRPEGGSLLSWGPRAFFRRVEDHRGLRLDRVAQVGMSFEFPNQTTIEFDAIASRERLRPGDAAGLDASADFAASGAQAKIASAPSDMWRLFVYAWSGRAIGLVPPEGLAPFPADQLYVETSVGFLPLRWLRLDLSGVYTTIGDDASGAGIFTNRIARLKGNLQIDPRVSIRGIVEWDDLEAAPGRTSLESGRRWNADLLLTYLVDPWTAVYVGANSNWRDIALVGEPGSSSVVRAPGSLFNDARQVFVKVSYLIRP